MVRTFCIGCQEPKEKDYFRAEWLMMICSDCRETLEIGRLVQKMPREYFLDHGSHGWCVREFISVGKSNVIATGDTPLEVLRKGVKK